jgi:hypothetical protein
MLWMMPVGGLNNLLAAVSRTLEALPERRMRHGMNICTLLDDAVRGFEGAAAEGWDGEFGRRQRLAGVYDPGGKRRRLFGVGEGPTEAVAEAKQERDGWRCGARSCQTGLHEPANCTKICTKPLRLAFGEPSANLRRES